MWETGWKFTFSTDDELEDHNLWISSERCPWFLNPDGIPESMDLFYYNFKYHWEIEVLYEYLEKDFENGLTAEEVWNKYIHSSHQPYNY
tara:strand:- start:578 stop:844 length:267 start_codon:yes stop_codon:yes gene_type:complete